MLFDCHDIKLHEIRILVADYTDWIIKMTMLKNTRQVSLPPSMLPLRYLINYLIYIALDIDLN